MKSQQPEHRGLRSWFTPHRLRTWREYLTAYLMIAPSLILIFTFGIFPVGFAGEDGEGYELSKALEKVPRRVAGYILRKHLFERKR